MNRADLDRYRWFNLEAELPFKAIVDAMNLSPYSAAKGWGFELDTVSRKECGGSFLEKVELKRRSWESDGQEVIVRLSFLERTVFELSMSERNAFMLRLTNPPSSQGGFFGKLRDALNSQIYISNVKFEPLALFKSVVDSKMLTRYQVRKVVASSLPIGERGIGKLEVLSESNALAEIQKSFFGVSFVVEKLDVAARISGEDGRFELRKSGTIVSTKNLIKVLEESL